jgi:uncharacterized protein (DUF433 family)
VYRRLGNFLPGRTFGTGPETVVLMTATEISPDASIECIQTLAGLQIPGYDGMEGKKMATPTLDWSHCPAVESIPGKRSGAWVFRGTRTPVSVVFENLQDMSVDELVDEFGVTREQVQAVLQFAAHSTEAPALHS